MDIIEPIRKIIKFWYRQIAKVINTVSGGKVTPNMVTTFGVIMHVPVVVLIINGHFIWATVFLLFFGLLDTLDGELARLTNKASVYGMVYDASADRINFGLVMAGVAQYMALNGQAEWVFVPVMAFVVAVTVTFVKAKGEVALALKHPKMSHHEVNQHFKSGLVPHEVLYILVAVGLLTGQLLVMSWVVLILRSISLAGMIKKVRQTV